MPRFLTELRERFSDCRWIGPVIEADSLEEAVRNMADSPYIVVGELVAEIELPDGTCENMVLPDNFTMN